MRRSISSFSLVLCTIAVLAAASFPAEAGARRTRPGGSSASSSSRSTSVSGRSRQATAPQRVRGRATYGYRHGYGYGYGYGSVHPYRYWYANPYWYWGWPYVYGWWWPSTWPQTPSWYVDLRGRGEAPGVVETDVRPKKSELFVDGKFVGQARDFNGTWDILYLAPGTHSVEFRKEGYKTLRYSMEIESGYYYSIRERLEKGDGLDPRSMEAPEVEGAKVATETAPAPPAESVLPSERGSLRSALLRIDAGPDDAAVYLDGEFLARADELRRLHGALPVAPGRHVIEVVRPGYTGQRLEVEVSPDEPFKVAIDLKRKP